MSLDRLRLVLDLR